jgi:hypothetical protein
MDIYLINFVIILIMYTQDSGIRHTRAGVLEIAPPKGWPLQIC